jgi:hypothetical protein
MKQCPKCKSTFEKSLSAEVPLDEISAKLSERQKNSGLCFDCTLAELMAELGAAALAPFRVQGIG